MYVPHLITLDKIFFMCYFPVSILILRLTLKGNIYSFNNFPYLCAKYYLGHCRYFFNQYKRKKKTLFFLLLTDILVLEKDNKHNNPS